MGNHDYAVGTASLDRFARGAEFPVLGANACFDVYGDYLQPYRILDKEGVRVAVLGITTPVIKYSMPSDRIGDLDIRDAVETAKYWVPYLRENKNADVVIGLFHTGLENGRMDNEGVFENSVLRVIDEVPGFDVIVYGHDHKACCLKVADCEGDSVLLINPGAYAMNAAVATVSIHTDGTDAPVVLTSGELKDITHEQPDRSFIRQLSGWYYDVKNYSDSIIGSVSVNMEGNGVLWRRSSIMDYVHSIQMKFNGAQISLSSPVFTESYFPSKELKLKDVFSLYRFENTMVSVMLKGSEVRDILEYSADLFYNTVSDDSGSMLRLVHNDKGQNVPLYPVRFLVTAAGIDYVIDVTEPAGQRVKILSLSDGSPFNPDSFYRTTINSYLYSGDESAVFKATGLSHTDIRERLVVSSMADIRYYIITDLSLRRETGLPVKVNPVSKWSLIPESIVSGCLAKDTVNFSVIDK